jgi:hypothetical protein
VQLLVASSKAKQMTQQARARSASGLSTHSNAGCVRGGSRRELSGMSPTASRSPGNRDGARAVGAELRRRFDRVWVGEESTGDGYWYVWAWHAIGLDERTHLARTTRRYLHTGWSTVTERGIVKGHS